MVSALRRSFIDIAGGGVLLASVLGYLTYQSLSLRPRFTLQDQSPTIIQRIRALSRLETVSFTEQKVLEGRKEWSRVPHWLAGDKLLFLAHGEVVAGVDLSQFGPQNLRIEGERASVRLPRPDVFHVRLDNQTSKVYDRSTGWLNGADPQMESDVRRRAEEIFLSAALQEGILNKAQQNAQSELRRLLTTMGVKEVTFI